MDIFSGNFNQQEPLSQEAIEAGIAVMRHGRIHRYNEVPGEVSQTTLLEEEFARQLGAKYCIAVASGGYALATALRALNVGHGDVVLCNAFTLAPVPGAIVSVGARPLFVGVTESLTIDLADLEAKCAQASVLMLSHMRGHICDMERLMEICNRANVQVIEDCAHTMGAHWNGVASGRHGVIGCYSTQSYKHVNSGEGGLLISDDPDLMARAILLSGSYMHYNRHKAAPPAKAFQNAKYDMPNISGRMDNLRAAILRPQLRDMAHQAKRWNERYYTIADGLRDTPGLTHIKRDPKEGFVASSYQFLLLDWPENAIRAVIDGCGKRGVVLKWFGATEPSGYTSRYDAWHFAQSSTMEATDRILHAILDMRLPLTFSLEDCALIARIVSEEVAQAFPGTP